MGYYLNNAQVFSLYESETKKPYFVDKTSMLKELISLVEEGNNHICITRPRRFGKSVIAAMVGAFFSNSFLHGSRQGRQLMNQPEKKEKGSFVAKMRRAALGIFPADATLCLCASSHTFTEKTQICHITITFFTQIGQTGKLYYDHQTETVHEASGQKNKR